MNGIEEVNLLAAFSGGLLSFLSPCVLPLIPVYLSFVSGLSFEQMTDQESRGKNFSKVFFNTLLFVLGFSIVFILLGFGASTIGQFLKVYQREFSLIAGLVIVVLALHFMGLLRIKWLYYEKRVQVKKRRFGPVSSFLLGFFFAFGWTPCIGPILASILLVASQQETASSGIVLLSAYSAGMAIPFMATAIFLNTFLGLFKKVNKYFDVIETAIGAVMLVAATWLIFSQFTYVLSATIPMFIVGIAMFFIVLFQKKLPKIVYNILTGSVVAAIIFVGAGLFFLSAPPASTEASGAINIQFDDFAGNPVNLEKFRGKPILLNFFASWCTPCKKEIPELIRIYEEKAKGEFYIVGINCDEEVDDGRKMIESMSIPYPVFHGKVDDLNSIGERTALPTNIIVDNNGKKVIAYAGFPGEKLLLDQIEKLK